MKIREKKKGFKTRVLAPFDVSTQYDIARLNFVLNKNKNKKSAKRDVCGSVYQIMLPAEK